MHEVIPRLLLQRRSLHGVINIEVAALHELNKVGLERRPAVAKIFRLIHILEAQMAFRLDSGNWRERDVLS